jgi:hypothetical protein
MLVLGALPISSVEHASFERRACSNAGAGGASMQKPAMRRALRRGGGAHAICMVRADNQAG